MKNQKGVTLVALVVTVIVLMILTFSLTVNIEDYRNVEKQKDFETDMYTLEEKINVYFSKNKQLPILNQYTYLDTIRPVKDANDGTDYYVIDIDKLEGIKLKLGKEFEYAKKRDISESISDLTDIYVINSQSHTIYYPMGALVYGEMKYTLSARNKEVNLAETLPYIPNGASVIENTTVGTGLTIRDKNKNEWVWVVVPISVMEKATTDEEIYGALENYASAYRVSGYTDTWYNGCGLTEAEYNANKSKMLNSIKTYGGFYIGRYELGTDNIRTDSTNLLIKPAVIQSDKYPYNYITCSQAQELCSELAPEKNMTSSMLYGIQWDLTLKFMENKGIDLGNTTEERQAKLKTDSSSWGNYLNSEFILVKGKYAENNTNNYITVTSEYKKLKERIVSITTGGSQRNRILNIYDLAGNQSEWTLEKSNDATNICISRGGSFVSNSMERPSVTRYEGLINISGGNIASRVTFYK